MAKSRTERVSRHFGLLVVVLLSLFALGLALAGAQLLKPWEAASADLRMRWRYHLTPANERTLLIHPEIALLAIDTKTQSKLGRFGAGAWLSRRAFSDQLSFFENYLHPSVLAYDIVIEDTQGEWARKYSISESSEKLDKIILKLQAVSKEAGETMPEWMLDQLNRFSMEQGNLTLVDRLAAISENADFDVLSAYYFKGGGVDPQPGKIRMWSDAEVFGNDTEGDENCGEAIPYLKDVAIPADNIHFQDKEAELNYDYSPNGRLPSLELRDYSYLGYVNCPRDQDSIVRRLPLILGFKYYNSILRKETKAFVPSFALASCLLHLGVEFPLEKEEKVVEVFLGKEIIIRPPEHEELRIPIDSQGRMYLNFNVELEDFPQESFVETALPSYAFSDELRKKQAADYGDFFKGRLVMVGVTEIGVDVGAYPLSSDKPTPLVHVHLTAVNNILNQTFLAPLSKTGRSILWAVLFCTFTIICLLERSAKLAPASFFFVLLYGTAAYAAVHMNLAILPVIGPILFIGICSFSIISYRFFTEERAKKKIRGMFSSMVSGKVLAYLEENPESLSLKGHNTEATVFFSDIAGFTVIGERLSPEKLTRLLNSYFTPTTDCILEKGGYLDKYVGDEVMAVWGAPYPDPEHAVKACFAALEQQQIIAEMNEEVERVYGSPLAVRMGINSGTVTAGNMGSERKFQYTVMGDTVNLASRLEPVNKDFGTSIIIGDTTYNMAKDEIEVRKLGKIVVVGKKEIVTIYELLGRKGDVDASRLKTVSIYEKALDQFHQRQWDACLATIETLPELDKDPAVALLKKRAVHAQKNPPAQEWQGEYVRVGKE